MKAKRRQAREGEWRNGRTGAAALAGALALLAGATAGEAQNPTFRIECARGGDCITMWDADLITMRPRLGVFLASGDQDGGVRVAGVSEDGPAARAGILEGDVIVRFAGHDLAEPVPEELDRFDERRLMQRNLEKLLAVPGVDTADAHRSWEESLQVEVRMAWTAVRRLRSLLSEVEEGDTVEVAVERDGEALTFLVSPEVLPWSSFSVGNLRLADSLSMDSLQFRIREANERIHVATQNLRNLDAWSADLSRDLDLDPDDWFANLSVRAPGADAWALVAGFPDLDLVDLNPGLGAYFGTSEGVLVAEIAEDSPLGLLPGDVVIDVDGRKVDDAAELRRILASYRSGEEIVFAIRRDGEAITVTGQRDDPSPPRPR